MSVEDTLRALQERVASMWVPAPTEADRLRTRIPIRQRWDRQPIEQIRWTSDAMDMRSYTCGNAFVSLSVTEDNVPGGHLVIGAVLQSSNGSASAAIASASIGWPVVLNNIAFPYGGSVYVGGVDYNGPGTYTLPLLRGADVLGGSMNLRILAYNAAVLEGGITQRIVSVSLDAMLICGHRY